MIDKRLIGRGFRLISACLVGTLLAVSPLPALAAEKLYKPACGDHLQRLGGKPDALHYLGCSQQLDDQGQPFEARYSVAGNQARAIQDYLGARFGMPPLRFICCGWHGSPHSYRDGSGYGHLLSFSSDETLEKRWPQIERFHLSVRLYAEDP